ncbi:PemK-like protein [Thiorhodovibrio winogradskyi]|uniref:PemK-like protein n=1 Tax=Thiorhodovibrio winogradskyi TaxID=77007 RepID=A0ABZ0SD03_9GAMM|nr:type II toxin-antitoxin system PemK/MazF family toxin [Thiorhodovibrio winogradskyi]
MKTPIVTYNAFDVVRVPFPFTDRGATKHRPALIISEASRFNQPAGHSVMAMITSAYHAPWPLDCLIEDLDAAGLPAPSRVRFKLFTLDHRLVNPCLGRLSLPDQAQVRQGLIALFNWMPT